MKKLLATTLFFLVATANSAFGVPKQACLNKLLEQRSPGTQYKRIEFVAHVSHAGADYHWIDIYGYSWLNRKADVVISTTSQGRCELHLFDAAGDLRRIEDYYPRLGKEVTEKFVQTFKQSRVEAAPH